MTTQKGQGAFSPGLLAFCLFAAVCALVFGALGVWQVERLAWKNGLIEAVETRSTAEPVDLSGANWPAFALENNEYRRVSVTGRFEEAEAFVQAVTVYGGGFWVMTPLRLDDGRAVLVNRGFVTAEQRVDGIPQEDGEITVTGLLRLSEPEGGFLRSNEPSAGRWYSRDVPALAEALGVDDPAPFFIDAEAGPEAPPVGGLTVLTFSNNHLVYALTWFGLAAMCLAGLAYLVRDRWRQVRRQAAD